MKPRLSRKARVQPDPRDGRPVLLSPERGLRLGDTAAAVVALCDGTREVEAIVDELTARYGAPRAIVARDVEALLADLHRRALLEGFEGHGEARAPVPEPPAVTVSPLEPPAPYTLVAELTHRCPLACPYCSNPTALVRGNEELSTGEWLRVLDEAAALGVMQMHLTGGEPLARADLEPIAARARERGLYVNLVTSGLPLERGRLERLAPSLDCVQLSIQDADGASSDRIAGLASHAQKRRVASWVKDLGLPLTVNVVLHRANLDRVEAVVAMAEELGADRLELANVQLVSWALENTAALLPTRAQIDRARVVAREAKERLAGKMEVVFVLPDWHADRPRACMDGWGQRFVVVAPDGAVLPCHAARALPLRFESVRGDSLARIWRDGEGMRAFRGESWMPEPCKSCDRRAVDHGGCRCQAFALTGDARATDPACSLAPQHGLVREARARAEGAKEPPRAWVYRGR
ncbi:MAG TPA: pyrroloquinoline quinone biosynthesis protein PqqE [Polyangiaceae bacterium]|nr:pyrroloquinoline quinone biosynthesis protein PqqE [Polyangiaceae bacterium]